MKHIGIIKVLKAICLLLPILCVAFYDFLPKNTMLLFPSMTKSSQAATDSWNGGNSFLSWQNEHPLEWTCHIREGIPYPYCGMFLTWSEERPFSAIDLSQYTDLEIDLTYTGEAKYIQIFLRNAYFIPNSFDEMATSKYSSTSVDATETINGITIPLDTFRVADWWISTHNISPTDIQTEYDQVISIGIDFRPPVVIGDHAFKLESLRVSGSYFSKESMYLGIIIIWASIFMSEGLVRYTKLDRKLKLKTLKITELTVQSKNYKKQSETDALTGILNRHGLNRIVSDLHEKQRLERYSLLILDIDHFKSINDKLGHDTGDIVLQELTQRIQKNTRYYDVFCRWGGEEFVILFHNKHSRSILPFAEKIRKSIEKGIFANGKLDKVTASIGTTKLSTNEDFEMAFRRADKALYKAKETGRNRTVVV
ncbi:GGDEF domain-containing protein [Agaribacter marinus]|uniref:GGDEF domain-containing protein n=1 Tax=Agaribacter marinus TaxID=1431249 RepID=UPI0024E16D81|nr:GGDEF domain-containing protein [Agaribacter marinus]